MAGRVRRPGRSGSGRAQVDRHVETEPGSENLELLAVPRVLAELARSTLEPAPNLVRWNPVQNRAAYLLHDVDHVARAELRVHVEVALLWRLRTLLFREVVRRAVRRIESPGNRMVQKLRRDLVQAVHAGEALQAAVARPPWIPKRLGAHDIQAPVLVSVGEASNGRGVYPLDLSRAGRIGLRHVGREQPWYDVPMEVYRLTLEEYAGR